MPARRTSLSRAAPAPWNGYIDTNFARTATRPREYAIEQTAGRSARQGKQHIRGDSAVDLAAMWPRLHLHAGLRRDRGVGADRALFGFSDTWQLVINTGTTIVTFLMVLMIQNTQNRDMSVLQPKLDELIRVNKAAHNKMLNLEELTEEQLAELKANFARLAVGGTDTDTQRDLEHDPVDAEEAIG
jgi:low affinity Fe/Cu permease